VVRPLRGRLRVVVREVVLVEDGVTDPRWVRTHWTASWRLLTVMGASAARRATVRAGSSDRRRPGRCHARGGGRKCGVGTCLLTPKLDHARRHHDRRRVASAAASATRAAAAPAGLALNVSSMTRIPEAQPPRSGGWRPAHGAEPCGDGLVGDTQHGADGDRTGEVGGLDAARQLDAGRDHPAVDDTVAGPGARGRHIGAGVDGRAPQHAHGRCQALARRARRSSSTLSPPSRPTR